MGSRGRARRWVTVAVVGLLAGTLGAVGWLDVEAHQRARVERAALDTAGVRLAQDRDHLSTTSADLGRAIDRRTALEGTIASTQAAASGAQSALTGAMTSKYLQGVDIGTIRACLSGVDAALNHIAEGDTVHATQDISSVSTPCRTLDGDGPVYPFDFPDPFVLRVGSTYYAYATNSAEGNIQIIESTDLVHWTGAGNALPALATWAAPNATWAPSVAQVGTTFVLYYSAVVAGPAGGEQCISAAVATAPQGPFVDASSSPLVCQPELGGSIDPSPFVDADGTPYLLWKSNGAAGQPATLWSQRLDATGTALAPGTPTPLLAADQAWEAGVVEAPDLVLAGGRYVLFYSGNNWDSASYAIGAATCIGPLGPCTQPLVQPILAAGSGVAGPGGASVFTDASGAGWMAFAAWVPGAVGYPHSRALYLRQVDLSGPTPVIGPPP